MLTVLSARLPKPHGIDRGRRPHILRAPTVHSTARSRAALHWGTHRGLRCALQQCHCVPCNAAPDARLGLRGRTCNALRE